MASSDDLTSSETWAFRPAFPNSWISEPFDSDAENLITNALQRSFAVEPLSSPVDLSSDLLAIVNPETPSSHQQQGQSVSTSGGGSGSDPETVSKRVVPRNAAPPNKKITKRKSRASKRSPTTFITADPENFRQMVQQVTGVRFSAGQIPVGSVLRPEPQRPVGVVNRLQSGVLLPTLDTSAFLLDHHQQVVGPAAAAVAGHGSLGFGPPAVVAEGGGSGFDFDGFSSFPTLDSWKVMQFVD